MTVFSAVVQLALPVSIVPLIPNSFFLGVNVIAIAPLAAISWEAHVLNVTALALPALEDRTISVQPALQTSNPTPAPAYLFAEQANTRPMESALAVTRTATTVYLLRVAISANRMQFY